MTVSIFDLIESKLRFPVFQSEITAFFIRLKAPDRIGHPVLRTQLTTAITIELCQLEFCNPNVDHDRYCGAQEIESAL
jgi:hypothetical protein